VEATFVLYAYAPFDTWISQDVLVHCTDVWYAAPQVTMSILRATIDEYRFAERENSVITAKAAYGTLDDHSESESSDSR